MEKVIGLMGAGRMGEAVAQRLAGKARLLINDVNYDKAQKLAEKVGGQAVGLTELGKAPMIIMALPTEVMAEATASLKEVISADTLLLNIATSCPKQVLIDVLGNKQQVVSVKFVGHAKEMLRGEDPTVVVDAPDQMTAAKVAEIFQSFGKVVFGSEEVVAKLNVLGATEAVRTALRVKAEMEKMGLPLELYEAVIRGVTAGTMKAYASGDMGPFVQSIVQKLSDQLN